jgi:hypothetical protein
MRYALILVVLFAATTANAQWEIQPAPTSADLRGIHSLGNGIAWASGSNGAVLRTTDGGAHWQLCPTPPGAEKLDFRGIQAFDANTAIVMSTGKGALSRLYKTTDGCQTWKLVFTNPDAEGSWDALQFRDRRYGVLLGDPVGGKFYARETLDGGSQWRRFADDEMLKTTDSAGFFAASNSSLAISANIKTIFAVGNVRDRSAVFEADFGELPCSDTNGQAAKNCPKNFRWGAFATLPLIRSGDSSGVFAVAANRQGTSGPITLVAVGGDYLKPDGPGSATYYSHRSHSIDDDSEGTDEWVWLAAQTAPHGFRSAVTYDTASKTWITVGPNGTDISTDDGRNWRALHLNPALHEPADADRNWNALSLPFVVGPHGRIGKLRPEALTPPKTP